MSRELTIIKQQTKFIRFENDLQNKISYKQSSKISHQTLLNKYFKFFDLHNTGYVNQNQFFRTLTKLGVIVTKPQHMSYIFNNYDFDNDGKIIYKQFIDFMIGNKQDQQIVDSKSPKKRLQEKNKFQELIQYIKDEIKKKGIQGLISLGIRLKFQDPEKSHFVHKRNFGKVLKEFFLQLKDQQIKSIFTHYDRDRDDFINYAQFIYSLRVIQNKKGILNGLRKSLIQSIFEMIDRGSKGEIDIQTLKGFFIPGQHYFKKKPEILRQQFYDTIRIYNDFQGIDDGIFTDQDFHDFMGFISFFQDNDQYFREFIAGSFQIDYDKKSIKSNQSRRQFSTKEIKIKSPPLSQMAIENKPLKKEGNFKKAKQQSSYNIKEKSQITKQEEENLSKNRDHNIEQSRMSVYQKSRKSNKSQISSTQIKQIELIILRMKGRLSSKGPKGFLNFFRALKSVDHDNDNLINIQEFRQVVKDLRIDITDLQIQNIFDLFDDQELGRIQIIEIYQSMKGIPNQKRKDLIERVWKQLDKHKQGIIPFSLIKNMVNPRYHPDVKNGRRHQDDIMKQLFESLQMIQELRVRLINKGYKGEQINQSQMIQFLQNLSASIADQNLFQTILTVFFKLGSQIRIEEKYAGSIKYFDVNQKNGYLLDHHPYVIKGGSVSKNAPYGTFDQPTCYIRPYH